MKQIVCSKCGEKWNVVGERIPFTNKYRVNKILLRCGRCGTQNTLRKVAN